MTLGEKIKKLRLENKMTQAELAEKLYVTRQAITNYERNANMPSIDILKSMAELFNVDLTYLLEDENAETKVEKVKVTKNKRNILLLLTPSCVVLVVLLIVTIISLFGEKPRYEKVGFYITFNENITYTIEELKQSNTPYYFNEYDKKTKSYITHRNIISDLEENTYLSNDYDYIYHYQIYNIIGTNKYRMYLEEQLTSNVTCFIESDYLGTQMVINFLNPVKKCTIIAYDQYDEILSEEVLMFNENNILCSNLGKTYENFESYSVLGAVRYYVTFFDGTDRKYNILESRKILIFLFNGEYQEYNYYYVHFTI